MDQSELIRVLLEKKNMAYKVQLCIDNCENEADKKVLVDGLEKLCTEIVELESQVVVVKEQSTGDKIREVLLNQLEYTILQIDTGLLSKRSKEIKEQIVHRDSDRDLPEHVDSDTPVDKTEVIEFLLNEMRILQSMELVDTNTLSIYREGALKRFDEYLNGGNKE